MAWIFVVVENPGLNVSLDSGTAILDFENLDPKESSFFQVDSHDLRFPWIAFFTTTYVKAGTELVWDYNYEVCLSQNLK